MPNKTSPPTDAPPAPADDAPRVPVLADVLARVDDTRASLVGIDMYPSLWAGIMALADVAEAAADLAQERAALGAMTGEPWWLVNDDYSRRCIGCHVIDGGHAPGCPALALDAALARLATGGTDAE